MRNSPRKPKIIKREELYLDFQKDPKLNFILIIEEVI